MNTKPLPRRSLIPTRAATDSAVYLPRLILIGLLLTSIGVMLATRHVPGVISLGDLGAVGLVAVGLVLVGVGVQPRERR